MPGAQSRRGANSRDRGGGGIFRNVAVRPGELWLARFVCGGVTLRSPLLHRQLQLRKRFACWRLPVRCRVRHGHTQTGHCTQQVPSSPALGNVYSLYGNTVGMEVYELREVESEV
jgi:hypothetical protein